MVETAFDTILGLGVKVEFAVQLNTKVTDGGLCN